MGVQISFNFAAWIARYPEFAPAQLLNAQISGTALSIGSVLGTLIAGQTLYDSTGALEAGTTLASGSGLSWVVSQSQTVSLEGMAAATASTGAMAQEYFNEATVYQDNTGIGPPWDVFTQTLTLNMLTAHIAALYNQAPNGAPASTIVGRISDATQGTVHVAATLDMPPGSAQWYNQTKYGASYWAATSRFRRAIYFPGCVRPGLIGPNNGPGYGTPAWGNWPW